MSNTITKPILLFKEGDINNIENFAELEGGEVLEVENHKTQQSITIHYVGSYGGILQFWANGNLTDLRGWEGVGEDESWEISIKLIKEGLFAPFSISSFYVPLPFYL